MHVLRQRLFDTCTVNVMCEVCMHLGIGCVEHQPCFADNHTQHDSGDNTCKKSWAKNRFPAATWLVGCVNLAQTLYWADSNGMFLQRGIGTSIQWLVHVMCLQIWSLFLPTVGRCVFVNVLWQVKNLCGNEKASTWLVFLIRRRCLCCAHLCCFCKNKQKMFAHGVCTLNLHVGHDVPILGFTLWGTTLILLSMFVHCIYSNTLFFVVRGVSMVQFCTIISFPSH